MKNSKFISALLASVAFVFVGSAALALGPQSTVGVLPSGQGLKDSHLVTTASTNATVIKASPGTVYTLEAIPGSSAVFVHFYNQATTPTCSTTPAAETIEIPATTSPTNNAKVDLNITFGVGYSAGIAVCVTGAAADGDTTNSVAGAIIDFLYN